MYANLNSRHHSEKRIFFKKRNTFAQITPTTIGAFLFKIIDKSSPSARHKSVLKGQIGFFVQFVGAFVPGAARFTAFCYDHLIIGFRVQFAIPPSMWVAQIVRRRLCPQGSNRVHEEWQLFLFHGVMIEHIISHFRLFTR